MTITERPTQRAAATRAWPILVAAALGLVTGVAVTAAAFLGLAAGPSITQQAAPPNSFTLNGTLELTDSRLDGGGGSCFGSGGYSDIAPGAGVTVYDAAGTVIATSSLGTGSRIGFTCTFRFTVPNVPAASEFYGVEVSHRGKVTMTRDEAKGTGAQLTLGN